MKIFLNQNVYEAAIERIEWLFDEFDTVYVSMSGGKDSTVIYHLCMEVAERRGRLPLKVLFLDQEAEWQAVIDYIGVLMRDPRVEPYWMQVPFRLTNSTSETNNYLDCWAPEKEPVWMRQKEAIAIKENTFGTDRFHRMFPAIMATWHPDEKVAIMVGIRAEESPARVQAVTKRPVYKGITWGNPINKGVYPHFNFYPIYDWSYTDVWKYIHESKVPYCKLYDYMYQYGLPVSRMRVSSLTHQTAVHSLFYAQEVEQDTWNKMVRRMSGIHGAKNLGKDEMFEAPKTLPWMFRTWTEYRDHLLEKFIEDPDLREKFRLRFAGDDERFEGMKQPELLSKVQIATILLCDTDFTKMNDWGLKSEAGEFRKYKLGKPVDLRFSRWIPDHILSTLPIRQHTDKKKGHGDGA